MLTDEPVLLVSLKEAAKMIGVQPKSLRIYINRKTITCKRIDKHIFFDKRVVENYIERQKQREAWRVHEKTVDNYYSIINNRQVFIDNVK